MHKIKALLVGLLIGVVLIMVAKAVQGRVGVFDVLAAPNSENHLEPPPEGTFNVQIQALEVTQGLRTAIPARTAPGGDLALHPDGATHIAGRRTVVRAYPWGSRGANTDVPALSAHLWAYRDGELLPGSPISPQNTLLEHIAPDLDLASMRADAKFSWNFLLPAEWTAADPEHKSFSLRFVVEANPAGPDHIPECQGCAADNHVTLEGQTFVHVPPIKMQPYFVDHTFTDIDGNEVSYPGPTIEAFNQALEAVRRYFPIGEGEQGLEILAPVQVAWHGALKADGKHVFAEAMIQRYLPGGSLQVSQDGVYHVFLFSPSFDHRNQVNASSGGLKTGLAWIGLPYVQAGARGYELVHELAHAVGLDHAGNQHGEKSYDLEYPDDCGRVEPNAYGFDIGSMESVPPDSVYGETHDFMSYERSKPNWVSMYTWTKLAQLLGQPGL